MSACDTRKSEKMRKLLKHLSKSFDNKNNKEVEVVARNGPNGGLEDYRRSTEDYSPFGESRSSSNSGQMSRSTKNARHCIYFPSVTSSYDNLCFHTDSIPPEVIYTCSSVTDFNSQGNYCQNSLFVPHSYLLSPRGHPCFCGSNTSASAPSIIDDVTRAVRTSLGPLVGVSVQNPRTSTASAPGASELGSRSSALFEEEAKRPRSICGYLNCFNRNGTEGEEVKAGEDAFVKGNVDTQEQHSEGDKVGTSDLVLDCPNSNSATTETNSPGNSSSSHFSPSRNMDSLTLSLPSSEIDSIKPANGNVSNNDGKEVASSLRKRMFVIQELHKTEEDYVRDLKDIIDGYMAIMRDPNSGIPMPEGIRGGRDKIIFGNIEVIYEWHRDIFCKALGRCLEHPEEIGPLFNKYERKLRMYVVYCQNKPLSEHIVSEYFDTYFNEIRKRLEHSLDICDLLIKPVQRIMKYQLLLKDILKYTERIGNQDEVAALKQACSVMHVVPKEANDMMDVGRLQGFEGKKTAQGKLLMLGPLICGEGTSASNFKGKELQVFLFEQIIILSEIVGKKTKFSNPVYIYKDHILVNKMTLTETVDDHDPCKFMIKSTDPKKPMASYICQTSEKEIREEWMQHLRRILQSQNDFIKALQSPIDSHRNQQTKRM